MRQLPGFFVVGAQKAGTTSLHRWLGQQPEVCLPTIKETHFFRDEQKFRRGVEWYLDWFPQDRSRTLSGEVDPEYMFFEAAPRRIRELVPDAKLVFVFRQPLERAYSQYQMSVSRGFESLRFGAALAAEPGRLSAGTEHSLRHHSYLARGRYAEQVERFLKLFPARQLLFAKFDDLFCAERGLQDYARICRFVGVSSSPELVDRSGRHNPAVEARSTWLRDLIFGRSALKTLAGRLVRSERGRLRLAQWLDRLNRKPRRPGDAGWRDEVAAAEWDRANVETEALMRVSGLDLDDWLVDPRG